MAIIPPTVNGYNYLEVVSAFQKSIRRGDEDVALFFAIEIEQSNRHEALWRRLKVIVSEDIGLANNQASIMIDTLHRAYKEARAQKKPNHPERLMLVHAILYLCRSAKSRLVDWALNVHYPFHGSELIDIPDYAFDMHTAKGRRLGRDLAHFAEHGAKLSNFHIQPNEDEYKQKALDVLGRK